MKLSREDNAEPNRQCSRCSTPLPNSPSRASAGSISKVCVVETLLLPYLPTADNARLELRKNHVPRYLFRAWKPNSGGGPTANMNTTTVIVPRGFMPGSARRDSLAPINFYDMPEDELYKMADGHYYTRKDIKSAFSSWAASPQLVISYAKYLRDDCVHVAVMDTHAMGDEVMVWHVPHLISAENHEHLAFGRIRGSAYQTVSLKDLEMHGLFTLLPELNVVPFDMFGSEILAEMFLEPTKSLDLNEIYLFDTIGSLFHELTFSIVTALLSIRPKFWRGYRQTAPAEEQQQNDLDDVVNIVRALRLARIPAGLHLESWTASGAVDTKIDLMSMMAKHASLPPPYEAIAPGQDMTGEDVEMGEGYSQEK